ncbi:RDD family protein [uncultured Chitinophaga sp.]|jgi:Predicted membrane protein/domain|uniref:RDD family protein n=1 Tax=uncultured Chitinophaga sp. TaxID=339340 RepID=UPI00261FC432|nr:RDD family protein [uncultured Chitinophaga sp.]
MESVNPNTGSEELLGDIHEIAVLNYASQGQRLANYLIDRVASLAISLLTGIFMVSLLGESYSWILDEKISFYLLIYTGTVIYYTLAEACLKGRTLGKLITSTHAVTNDGKPLGFRDAFVRSLSRIVPFEAFSGFGAAPWHDQWTSTTVVKN